MILLLKETFGANLGYTWGFRSAHSACLWGREGGMGARV